MKSSIIDYVIGNGETFGDAEAMTKSPQFPPNSPNIPKFPRCRSDDNIIVESIYVIVVEENGENKLMKSSCEPQFEWTNHRVVIGTDIFFKLGRRVIDTVIVRRK